MADRAARAAPHPRPQSGTPAAPNVLKRLYRDSTFSAFLERDFEATEFAVSIISQDAQTGATERGKSGVESFLADLAQHEGAVDTAIHDLVSSNHDSLLARVGGTQDVRDGLDAASRTTEHLHLAMLRMKADVIEPSRELRRRLAQTERMQGTCDALRAASRLLHAVKRIRGQLPDTVAELSRTYADAAPAERAAAVAALPRLRVRDLGRAAASVHEVHSLLASTDLRGVSAVDAQRPFVGTAARYVRHHAREALRAALQQGSHAELGASLQVFFNLRRLAPCVAAELRAIVEAIGAAVRSALDVDDAVASTVATAATGAGASAATASERGAQSGSGPVPFDAVTSAEGARAVAAAGLAANGDDADADLTSDSEYWSTTDSEDEDSESYTSSSSDSERSSGADGQTGDGDGEAGGGTTGRGRAGRVAAKAATHLAVTPASGGAQAARGASSSPAPSHQARLRRAVWSRVDGMASTVHELCMQAWTLLRVLLRRRDPVEHRLFADVIHGERAKHGLKSSLADEFWLAVSATVKQEVASACDASPFLRGVLVSEYPRLRGVLQHLLKRLAASTEHRGSGGGGGHEEAGSSADGAHDGPGSAGGDGADSVDQGEEEEDGMEGEDVPAPPSRPAVDGAGLLQEPESGDEGEEGACDDGARAALPGLEAGQRDPMALLVQQRLHSERHGERLASLLGAAGTGGGEQGTATAPPSPAKDASQAATATPSRQGEEGALSSAEGQDMQLGAKVAHRDALLSALSPLLEVYLARANSRVHDPVAMMFGGDSKGAEGKAGEGGSGDDDGSELPTLPTKADVSTFISVLSSELSAARQDLGLSLAVARSLAAAARGFASAALRAAAPPRAVKRVVLVAPLSTLGGSSAAAAQGSAGAPPANAAQRHNIALASLSEQLRSAMQALPDTVARAAAEDWKSEGQSSGHSAQEEEEVKRRSLVLARSLAPALRALQSVQERLLSPYVAAAVRAAELVLAEVHLESYAGPRAEADQSGRSKDEGAEGRDGEVAAGPPEMGAGSAYFPRVERAVEVLSRAHLAHLPASPVCDRLRRAAAARTVRVFCTHVSLVRPLVESGKLRLAGDMARLEMAASQIHKATQLGAAYTELRALRALLFMETEDFAGSPLVKDLRPSTVLHHVLARGPAELPSPHTLLRRSQAQYVDWMDEEAARAAGQSQDRVALQVASGGLRRAAQASERAVWEAVRECADAYVQRMSAGGAETGASKTEAESAAQLSPVYHALLDLGPRLLSAFGAA